MRFLYIFPHPDDESFGPAAAMAKQLREGHEVHLLTLTMGGATKVRHKLGLTVEEMGLVRRDEMLEVEKVLGLTSFTILDLPDSGLKEMDPRILVEIVRENLETVRPDIVVTYPVHGISGFHDHLVTHAVVKHAWCELKEEGADYLRRLAFFTLAEEGKEEAKDWYRLHTSIESEIDAVMNVGEEDLGQLKKALDCYKTYQETIQRSGVVDRIGNRIYFEIYAEEYSPPLQNLTDRI